MAMRLSNLTIKANGQELETMPGATLDLGGWEKKPVTGDHRHLGSTRSLKQSMIECEIAISADTRLADIQNWGVFTATCEADTGQVYLVSNAEVSDTLKLTAGEGGKVPIKIFGDPAVEIAS